MTYRILQGDVIERLRELPDESVHCVVTSPPYWGLRDYGVDGQIGLEKTPGEYVVKMVDVFREVRRVLRSDGTCWVNMGDSYSSGGRSSYGSWSEDSKQATHTAIKNAPRPDAGLKPKDLVGMPWRLAFALQDDGWWLRQDIVWSKPNPMPESVTDRCTKAHEYLFLLTKNARYYWDFSAMQERTSGTAHARGNGVNPKSQWKTPDGWDTSAGSGGHGNFHRDGREDGHKGYTKKTGRNSRQLVDRDPTDLKAKRPKQNESFSGAVNELVEFRNRRSVWEIATEAFPEAHFATFPTELVKPSILAGSPADGTVLDPFNGSGTTGVVALRYHRNYIGIELNPEYARMAENRIKQDNPMFNQAVLA